MTHDKSPIAQAVADMTKRNKRVQARYDELRAIGNHGHYETMFRIVQEEVEHIEARSDAEMERVKACEHIAEGDEGWEVLENLCPSTASVAKLRRQLDALASAQPEPRPMEWKPIETAPKDGSKVILARFGWTTDMTGTQFNSKEWRDRVFDEKAPRIYDLWWCASGSFSEKYKKWWDGVEPSGFNAPTHWMPIPDGPKPTVTPHG